MEVEPTWQYVFYLLIVLVTGFVGAPITQFLKNQTGWVGRQAILLTAGVSLLLAVGQLLLTGALGLQDLNPADLPATILGVFGLASLYYGWMKGSEGVLGRGGLLHESEKALDAKEPCP